MTVTEAAPGYAMGHDGMQEAIALLMTALPGARSGYVLVDMTPNYTRFVGDFGAGGAQAFDAAMRHLSPDPFARVTGDAKRRVHIQAEIPAPSNHARIEARHILEARLRAAGAGPEDLAAIFGPAR